ncbi:hypothetical protein UA08_06265 [Talaromyces atroroseus]|uniref:Uncharacterized protein n=1 Tax=Talaromyces atroroseus TaxID=1441469 RepID=A0A225AYX3_TALAT|nr:hypothetical protein UA08_06265 [Talaromyces atroroseus]OKL58707.1 hypothetical protein UA08_06265 [Talaromyces atroroseus]
MTNDRHSGNERRFRPELIESTSRSSRAKNVFNLDSQAPSIDQNRPIEGSSTATTAMDAERPRRILPQPTETSSRSSRKNLVTQTGASSSEDSSNHPQSSASQGLDSKKPNRPLPQPFEVKTSNGKGYSENMKHGSESEKEDKRGLHTANAIRKFYPEPIETVKMSRRKPVKAQSGSNSSSSQSTPPRKFTPQLIETGKRSFRQAETLLTPGASRSFDGAFGNNGLSRPTSPPISRGQQMTAAREESSYPTESPFSYASLLQRQEGRRHSFRVPDLPAIPSNSSEGSDNYDLPPSLSTTPSASSEESANRLAAKNRFRESCDERFSGYLLSLAARSAEKQLQDQALAAFPNEQDHQPVSHFAIDGDEEFGDEDIDAVATTMPRINNRGDEIFRRESLTDLTWELDEMRRHKEVAELKDLGVRKSDAHESKFSAAAIAARQSQKPEDKASLFAGWRRDLGLAQMRHAASPPMLGDDIVFTLSVSPQGSASETDQMVSVSQAEPAPPGDMHQTGLWTTEANVQDIQRPGLWMGLCLKDQGNEQQFSPLHKARNGIATPKADHGTFDGSYFDLKMDLDDHKNHNDSDVQSVNMSTDETEPLPTTPKTAAPETKQTDAMEHEFDDRFVTQVYNYLSLGYPSLARYYDLELSKISGIPVAELRQDDLRREAKGYVVNVPNGNGPENCMRWKALRLYIKEWTTQRPEIDLNNDESLDAWGVIERRGSWAV